MKIEHLMTGDVRTCGPNDNLSLVAQAMWDGDCGCLPVVDAERRVVGMITDRDVCMAAHLRGTPLWGITVAEVMAKVVYACRATEKISAAVDLMTEHRLRRLPVVDEQGRLAGLITLGSLAHSAAGKDKKKHSRVDSKDVAALLNAITSPRVPPITARAVIEVHRQPAPDKATLQPQAPKSKRKQPAKPEKKSRSSK
jgi:CBS domain-containing protein